MNLTFMYVCMYVWKDVFADLGNDNCMYFCICTVAVIMYVCTVCMYVCMYDLWKCCGRLAEAMKHVFAMR